MPEFDSPWKEMLDEYFEPFLALCFPEAHHEIDWTRGYEMLDKELQKIAPQGETGRRIVDKLLRVWHRSGEEEWFLVHVEVQSQGEAHFEHRMFVYHARLRDRYNRERLEQAENSQSVPIYRLDARFTRRTRRKVFGPIGKGETNAVRDFD